MRGRPRTGTLIQSKRTGLWSARITRSPKDRPVIPLHTKSKKEAKEQLARLLADTPAIHEAQGRPEPFEVVARRVVDEKKRLGKVSMGDRISRLERYVFPWIGAKLITDIESQDVARMLDAARDKGLGKESLAHLRCDVSSTLKAARRYDKRVQVVTADVTLPDLSKVKQAQAARIREVLTDAELFRYLSWIHPDERQRGAVLERQMMSLVSRCWGGLRTSDLHALTWPMMNAPDFLVGQAPSEKTGTVRRIEIPAMLRPFLRDWWERAGKPREGLLFAIRRGERAGEARQHSSHAQAFRRDLRRCFGIEAPKRVERVRKNGRPGVWLKWKQVREPTDRERALLEGTERSRAVDFHSWRRGFVQAAENAGLPGQQGRQLSGHGTETAFNRYAQSTRTLVIPKAVLPAISATVLTKFSDIQSGWWDLNPQQPAPKAQKQGNFPMFLGAGECTKDRQIPEALRHFSPNCVADRLLGECLRSRADALAFLVSVGAAAAGLDA